MSRRILVALLFAAVPVFSQENYEIQVYASETVEPGSTMVELHSNFTAEGTRTSVQGVLPTQHAWHETVEVTRGLTEWFETGVYLFTSSRSQGWDFVGSHIRPRVRVPEEWKWPVGVSLSAEFGFERRSYSQDTWTLELRPIVDKKSGRLYWSLNPTLDLALAGLNASRGLEFSPNAKISFDLSSIVSFGVEYYGALGPVSGFDSPAVQQHQLFPAIDLNISPKWEINLGYGLGLTRSTDHRLIKLILGHRFGKSPKAAP